MTDEIPHFVRNDELLIGYAVPPAWYRYRSEIKGTDLIWVNYLSPLRVKLGAPPPFQDACHSARSEESHP